MSRICEIANTHLCALLVAAVYLLNPSKCIWNKFDTETKRVVLATDLHFREYLYL